MLAGDELRSAIEACVHRPFRVEPFFDPGPWGGHWMQKHFHLPDGPPNYAWGFDCVPEENTLVLQYGRGAGAKRFRLPAIVPVHEQPQALLGDCIHQQFGAEFPIRFDLLDTVGGGNLSLQVHPLTSYIREHFGMAYTQDESYYMLDSIEGAQMYLGLRSGVDPAVMRADLESARSGEIDFPAEAYANILPTHKHDHFAIPAGTVHCSGAGNVVLEISATPYIFTFKLWDWARLGMNGKPRPLHLKHGFANIQWDRDTHWVQQELQNQVEPVAEGDGWREERTGLHALEFIETRRTWFTRPVTHDTGGNLHVLNLVEGNAALVESPTKAFEPFEVHYAETFIVPAAVGAYTISPLLETTSPLATIKAYVRCR
jgi:mannose-6-phosphate isomerase class I